MESKNDISSNSETPKWLNDLKNKESFTTPSGYFNELENEILSKTINKRSGTVVSLFRVVANPKFSIPAVAASLLLFFSLFYNSSINTKTGIDNIDYEDIASLMIDESYMNVDEAILLDVYIDGLELEGIENTTDDEVLDFLLEEDIDYSTILNEL